MKLLRDSEKKHISYHIQMPVKTHDIWANQNINDLQNPEKMEDSHVVYNSIGVIHLSLSIPFRS